MTYMFEMTRRNDFQLIDSNYSRFLLRLH